jgi:hypothetical protein
MGLDRLELFYQPWAMLQQLWMVQSHQKLVLQLHQARAQLLIKTRVSTKETQPLGSSCCAYSFRIVTNRIELLALHYTRLTLSKLDWHH